MLSSLQGEADISGRTCREWYQHFQSGDVDFEERHGLAVEKGKCTKIPD